MMSMNVWESAVGILQRHLTSPQKLDVLLEALPSQWTAVERRRCRSLIYGVVRHRALLSHVLDGLLRVAPRPRLRAALLIGAFELLEAPEQAPAIVHHAVERSRACLSANEARLVNAVLRRANEQLQALMAETVPDEPAALALRYSHPAWLVERWLARFGHETTRALLEWNQQPAPVHARVLMPTPELPPGFIATTWTDFFRLDRPDWATVERLLHEGAIYLQDPATALAPELLQPAAGESILDLCASPGGKTLQLAGRAGPDGVVVAIDLPGPRLERLRKNVARYPQFKITAVGADVTRLAPPDLAADEVPAAYDAVLIDVPCSNTGVLRHRVDAKWRLKLSDLEALPRLQLALLRRAAACVRPGGRLVYSTCSLEPEENEDVVAAFLRESGDGFKLVEQRHRRPWADGCDGAGACLIHRSA